MGSVHERQRAADALLDHQDAHRAFARYAGQHGEQLGGDQRRQPERRLIEQQKRWLRHQRATDRHHLLLAAAHGAHRLVATFGQPGEQGEDALQIDRSARARAARENPLRSGSP
jgi:hypothetical protein